MSVTTLERAVTRCSLVGAAVIVTSGSLGDVFGRKRAFQLGLMLSSRRASSSLSRSPAGS